ncbi:MAG: response regulator [Acidobacteriota bacterium]|nr:response regulator [Acidobacteriota bacterium]
MRRKILLADDSVTIRKVVELTFMEEDYEMIAAEDGREAVAQLDVGVPDLVIADVHMPEVDGFEVCREVKRRYPEVPVLLLVGAFEPFDPSAVEACGGDGLLKKPFDSQDLLRKVGDLLEHKTGSATADIAAVPGGQQVAESGAFSEINRVEAEEQAVKQEPMEETSGLELSDEAVERIARRVVELLSTDTVREVAWEVVPDMAETVVRDRLRELESQVD